MKQQITVNGKMCPDITIQIRRRIIRIRRPKPGQCRIIYITTDDK